MKVKTIKLSPERDFGELRGYRVIQVTDSLEFSPSSTIAPEEAERLCESKHWRVTIVEAK